MKKWAVLVSVLALLACGKVAWADIDYTGALGNLGGTAGTDVGGILGSGNAWMALGTNKASTQGVHLSWDVDYSAATGLWTYDYIFTTGSSVNKNFETFDLSYGGSAGDINITSAQSYAVHPVILPATPTGTATTSQFLGLGTYTEYYGSGVTNPTSLTVTGLKWSVPTTDTTDYTFTLALQTQDAPVWGDFVAEGALATGSNQGQTTYTYMAAYDSQFGTSTNAAADNGNNGGYVLVPGASPVPIPPSLFTFAAGLAGLGLIRKRRIKP